ncbi:hypothetical protein [Thiohalomonas denitrificans]|uniref:hypothetical protein n=1 Tax=Thiohalomonas denitrificans TaxID=415747 RepID=UPI0026ECC579|nr:hypothetical protein [Thiohalomonas denitrificans]
MNGYQWAVWIETPGSESGEVCGERRFLFDAGEPDSELTGCCLVSPRADAPRIEALLAAGAEQVLLGESALYDSALFTEAIARYGGERIGVWLPVHRAKSSWALDTTSNADFNVVAVSNPVPRWLVLQADRTPTDVDAQWWAGQMIAAGCGTLLVSVEAPEDDDLLACAEMAEIAGERFWLDSGSDAVEELRFWTRYGQARRLVLPAGCDVDGTTSALEERLAGEEGVPCSG